MGVVDQGLERWLPAPERGPARTKGIAKLALNDRVDRLRLPALTLPAIPPGGGDPLRPGLSLRIDPPAIPADRVDPIALRHPPSVKTGIPDDCPTHFPDIAPQSIPKHAVVARARSLAPGQNERRWDAHGIGAPPELLHPAARSAPIIGAGLGRGDTRCDPRQLFLPSPPSDPATGAPSGSGLSWTSDADRPATGVVGSGTCFGSNTAQTRSVTNSQSCISSRSLSLR